MAIVETSRASFVSTSLASSYVVPSFTLPANEVCIARVLSARSGAEPTTPTISGWTLITAVAFNTIASPTYKVAVFRRVLGSPSTGTLTVSFSENQLNCLVSIDSYTATTISGTNGENNIRGVVTDRLDSVKAIPLTLGAFLDATNNAGLYIMGKATSTVPGVDTGWTLVHSLSDAGPGSRLFGQYRVGEDTSVTASWDPSASTRAAAIGFELRNVGGGTAYSLTANAGALVLAGVNAGLGFGRKLTANAGALVLSGTAASLRRALVLLANSGTLTLGGVTATLTWSGTGGVAYELDASPGALTLAGTAASLKVGRVLQANAGSLTLSGTTASLRRAYYVLAQAGALVLAGQAAGLSRGYRLAANAGALTLAGTAASLKRGLVLSAQPGALLLSGQVASLTWSGETLAAGGVYIPTHRARRRG